MPQTSLPVLHAKRFGGQIDEPTLFEMIRRQNCVPAVLLARRGVKDILSLDAAEVEQATQKDDHPVVRLEVDADSEWARVAEVAHDSYGPVIWYVELTRLPKGEVVVVDVPIRVLRGTARSCSQDIITEHLRSLRIEGPVELLPAFLTVDARGLRVPESITVADLKLPSYCEPIDVAPDTPIVTAVADSQTESARTTGSAAKA